MNPDTGARNNANGINLNRNFPQLFGESLNIFDGGPFLDDGRQPETVAIMQWSAAESFTLAANFHTGALVVNYPYDNDGKGSVYSACPDDLLFKDISIRYSKHNPPMWNSVEFPDGITNGAAWYVISGGMQDWNYRYLSCKEVTIELSNNFRPPASQIPSLWNDNSESMLSFLEAVHIGVRGLITDRASGAPLWAQVLVKGNSQPVFTDPNMGDYHRMLLPGIYDLAYHAYGYMPRLVKNVSVIDGHAVRVDVELIPEQASPDFNGDGIVDLQDLLILIEYWGQDELTVDIAPLPNGDGIVDEQDLALLMEYWQEEIPDLESIAHWIAHWKLDETEGDIAYDSAGENDAVVFGDALWQPTGGKIDGALQLDGIDDYVSTPFVLNPAEGAFSAFAWVKGGAPGQVVLSQRGVANWLIADPSAGNLLTELKSPGLAGGLLVSQTVITDGNWHRISLVWDGSNRTLYVDDVEVARDTQARLAGPDWGLYFGAGSTLEAGSFWSGLIDDVRIYNRVVRP